MKVHYKPSHKMRAQITPDHSLCGKVVEDGFTRSFSEVTCHHCFEVWMALRSGDNDGIKTVQARALLD